MKDERRNQLPFYERVRIFFRELLRNGRVSTWTAGEDELDDATRPPGSVGQAGENPVKRPDREFRGIKFEGKF